MDNTAKGQDYEVLQMLLTLYSEAEVRYINCANYLGIAKTTLRFNIPKA